MMEVDEDDIVTKKPIKAHRKSKCELLSDDEAEDSVVMEYDVVVCDDIPNTEMYRVQFPQRKKRTFDQDVQPRIRYKKNVKLLEMRLAADTSSGSFNKVKADQYSGPSGVSVKNENSFIPNTRTDEIYEGRAFTNENPLQYAVGYIRGDTFCISPLAGSFDMHRSINHVNSKQKGKEDDGDLTGESDTETPSGSGQKQLRVKFARPETERQKKRRESSALHREKLIANDPWVGMHVHLDGDPAVYEKLDRITPQIAQQLGLDEKTEMRDLVRKAIICDKMEQLDLSRGDQLMSHQRIRDLPSHLQINAQVIKARVISTDAVARRVDGAISRADLISGLQKCAHLVKGVWVLKSEHLFVGLSPAHSNVPGKIDVSRSEVWREARDLALCLVDANQPVTRATLIRCFHLNSKDAEEILSTFGVKADRTWKLKIPADEKFEQDDDNLSVVVQERRFWLSRWAELKEKIQHVQPTAGSSRNSSPKRPRRNSDRSGHVRVKEEK